MNIKDVYKLVTQQQKQAQKGQILLVAVLISSLLLTIGLAITQTTIQDTRNAKLQEDSVRARAAAEAGIDYILNAEPTGIVTLESVLPDSETDITGTTEITTETSTSFTTPLLSKDAQYTFYMTGYDDSSDSIVTASFASDISVSKVSPADSGSCTSNAFAVELTFINSNSGIVTRRIIDTECDLVASDPSEVDISFDETIATSGFSTDPHVVIARIIAPNDAFEGAKLTVNRLGGGDWPAQGRVITSQAQTAGSVYKKIRLFQSYPQIPAEFFVTTF